MVLIGQEPTISTRKVHLVGSLPVTSTHAGFNLARSTLGESLGPLLPDGEPGDRQDWIVRLIERLRHHPALELAKDGDWSGYDRAPSFRVRPRRKFEWVDLDYVDAFQPALEAFQSVRPDLTPGSALQVGIPGPLDLAMVAFGFSPIDTMRRIAPFRDATVRQISVIAQAAPDAVVFQLELPIEVSLMYRAPKLAARPLSRLLAREITKVVGRGPTEVRYGIHLCTGDMNNEAMVELDDLRPLVTLVNAIVEAWPSRRRLEFVHLPLAGATTPAPTDAKFYRPLGGLKVSPNTRLIAGSVHESDSIVAAVERLATIEGIVDRQVDLAAPCGLGRRSPEDALRNLELSRKLATTPVRRT